MTRTLVIALVLSALSCARAAPAPRVCEATPTRAKDQPTVVGMCTLDAPPTKTDDAAPAHPGHDEDAGPQGEGAEPTPTAASTTNGDAATGP